MVTANLDNVKLEAAVLDPEISARGFVLTCSATVAGPGVALELGVGDKMYDVRNRCRIAKKGPDAQIASALESSDVKYVGHHWPSASGKHRSFVGSWLSVTVQLEILTDAIHTTLAVCAR